MHNPWPQLAANAREIRTMMQKTVHQGAIPVPWSRMHRETRRLVDHNQMLIFKEHIQVHRLRLQIGQWLGWRHPHLHLIPLAEGGLRFTRSTVHTHQTRIDELLDSGATLFAALTHKPAIKPHGQRLGVCEAEQLSLAFTKRLVKREFRKRRMVWQRTAQNTGKAWPVEPALKPGIKHRAIPRWAKVSPEAHR